MNASHWPAEGAAVAVAPKACCRPFSGFCRYQVGRSRVRWTADVVSRYLHLEYFIWRHAAAQKAGVKGAAAREEA